MVYDAAGRVLQSSDPMGRVANFSYNALGQPTSADFAATTNTPAETVSYSYDTNGRMLTVSDLNRSTTMAYYAGCDRVKSVTDSVTGTIFYTYGKTGERATMTLPNGEIWKYVYQTIPNLNVYPSIGLTCLIVPKPDVNSVSRRLVQIIDGQNRICEYNIDRTGLMVQAKWNQTFDGMAKLIQWCQTDYVYDTYGGDDPQTHGWLKEIKNTFHQFDANQTEVVNVLTQNDYTYNKAGMRLQNQISNNAGVVRTETYGYDNLYRLTNVNYGDGETQTYSFDSMGNRLQKTDNGASENYTYNAANMLLTRGVANYTNDANGNTLTGGGRTNTWDSQNRLTQCVYNGTTSQFTYASDGLRHRSMATTGSNVTTTDSILDGSMMVQDVASTNGGAPSTATYLISPRGPEYRKDANGVKWYSYDGLGAVLGEVDLNGNLTATRSYDVYGAKRTWGGAQSTNHGFVGSLGHPSEDSTGMIYMRARYMDPAVGRFVSQDPNKHSSNWFEYASSNPTNAVDIDGKVTRWQNFWACVALLFGLLVVLFTALTLATIAAAATAGIGMGIAAIGMALVCSGLAEIGLAIIATAATAALVIAALAETLLLIAAAMAALCAWLAVYEDPGSVGKGADPAGGGSEHKDSIGNVPDEYYPCTKTTWKAMLVKSPQRHYAPTNPYLSKGRLEYWGLRYA